MPTARDNNNQTASDVLTVTYMPGDNNLTWSATDQTGDSSWSDADAAGCMGGGPPFPGHDFVAFHCDGVLDLVVEQTPRPLGHGYTEGTVEQANPFFETGTQLRGHEFHYSRTSDGGDRGATVVGLGRGTGIGDGRDAIVKGRVWASYLHLHALGTPAWAPGLVGAARTYRDERDERRERPEVSAACG